MSPAGTRDEQGATVHGAAFFPPDMRRGGEWLWHALLRPGLRMEDFGAPSLTLIHDTGVFELLNESFFSSVEDYQFFRKEESDRP